MVKIIEPKTGELCRVISVDGFSDYVNPKRARLSLYTLRMGMPEKDGEEQILQLAKETELLIEKDLFLKFAERVDEIRKWMLKHPMSSLNKGDVKNYVAENFTSEDIIAMWLGHDIEMHESLPFILLPIVTDEKK